MNLLVGLREPKSTCDASHLERCGVINFIHMCFPQMAGILQLLDFGCRTNMTNIYAVVLQMMRCIFRVWCLSQTQKTMCARAHTQKITTGHAHSAYHSFISFVVFLLSNSSNCCSRGTIFGAGALRLHPTKENTTEHLTKQGLCWR